MTVKLVWITPDAEELIVHMARVSNPASQKAGGREEQLITYLIKHKHWSPFEMVSACFEITTTRDIARQMLRHRSFSFQEFSQRYEDVEKLPSAVLRELRVSHPTNRQMSRQVEDADLHRWWDDCQHRAIERGRDFYQCALERGVSKEIARAVLPEGLTASRLYMAGNIRSWIHYCDVREGEETQKEHRLIATAISAQLALKLPSVWRAVLPSRGEARS